MAGLCYVSSIFLTIQANNSNQDYITNRNSANYAINKSRNFDELASIWESMARTEYLKHGDTLLYHKLLHDSYVEKETSAKLKIAYFDYSKKRDAADEDDKKWTNGSYVAMGMGTVFLVKGVISYTRRHKKKKMSIEFQPYQDTLGLQLSYAF